MDIMIKPIQFGYLREAEFLNQIRKKDQTYAILIISLELRWRLAHVLLQYVDFLLKIIIGPLGDAIVYLDPMNYLHRIDCIDVDGDLDRLIDGPLIILVIMA